MNQSLWAFTPQELASLLQHQETPAFFYSAAVARASYESLRAVLPARVILAYAVKANPFPQLLQHFHRLGAHFDCASLGELHAIAPYAQQKPCFFTGPGKSAQEIQLALQLGVRIHAESAEDLLMVQARTQKPAEVSLRVHPLQASDESKGIIGGSGPAAFGIDEETLPEFLTWAKTLDKVRITGIHVFTASNQTNAERLHQDHSRTFRIAQQLSQDHGLRLDWIDLGGGLGVPYASEDPQLNLHELGQKIHQLIQANPWFQGQIVLEPGRYLSAACGLYLTQVRRDKHSRGQRFVVCAGGINHLIRPLLTGQSFPVRLHDPSNSRAEQPRSLATLTGPLCTSLDRIGQAWLPPLQPGDQLVFGMCGAYGSGEALSHFLSHQPANEVWVAEDESALHK